MISLQIGLIVFQAMALAVTVFILKWVIRENKRMEKEFNDMHDKFN